MYAIYHGSSTDVPGIPASVGGPTASKFVNLFGQSGNHSIQVWNQGKSYFPGSTAGFIVFHQWDHELGSQHLEEVLLPQQDQETHNLFILKKLEGFQD